MSVLHIHLFGKLCLQHDGHELSGPVARKAQELLGYLLLYRNRPHPREALANVFWSDIPTSQSKTYLRKALWQLQATLDSSTRVSTAPVLLVESDWVQVNSAADIWLDVAVLEQTFGMVQGVPGEQISSECAVVVRETAALYRGDLLDGWYQDWCLFERERLQNMYLALLDKLMGYGEAHQEYEQGIVYGADSLRHNRAREATYRRLMRLHYLAGDRSAALRQYERCVAALDEELGVSPTDYTTALYEQIKANRLDPAPHESHPHPSPAPAAANPLLSSVLDYLKKLQASLEDAQERVQHDIRLIEQSIHGRR
ncbi:MAG TPA: bacterial transcriptional activator domain-containing protein [Herpetosiphonaceae bacterium]|nr:bacterial transcriptional activator domain-containing protein [Herpetosiphonaceae bacterium]